MIYLLLQMGLLHHLSGLERLLFPLLFLSACGTQERLEREYGLDLITTAPSVVYRVLKRDGEVVECSNPAEMPDASVRTEIQEPFVRVSE